MNFFSDFSKRLFSFLGLFLILQLVPQLSFSSNAATAITGKGPVPFSNLQQAKVRKQQPGKKSIDKIASESINRLIVKFKTGTSQKKISAVEKSFNLKTLKSYRSFKNLKLMEVDAGTNPKDVLASLVLNPDIEYIEIDQPVSLRQVPDDADYTELWALNNSQDTDINAVEAWDAVTGSPNVVLAVIDTGIDYTHEDLRDNMWRNPGEIPANGIDDDRNGYIDDVYGIDPGEGDTDPIDPYFHGSHVAGIIAARGNNTLGVTGVNWNSKVLSCKIFSFEGASIEGFASRAIECLDYIFDLKVNHGINIVASNNSWGWTGVESLALKEAIERNADAGILFVAAAGNSENDNDGLNDYPSTYFLPNIIAVAASEENGAMSYFSSFGQKTVHVTAPITR